MTAVIRIDPWPDAAADGVVVRTAHYAIHTTVLDPAFHRDVAAVLEGAHDLYAALAPSKAQPDRPFDCFVFRLRSEWEAFTRTRAGDDATAYFQINRGGYTIGDQFAVFSYGRGATCRSVAHEGWHQYAARHFTDRLPPFLEEGIACLFENVRVDETGRATWDLQNNHNRSRALRTSKESERLFSLEELITLHAGEVVGSDAGSIEAFYAQNWAFARFLWDGENGRYRPALRRLLNDAMAGELKSSGGRVSESWDARSAAPLLEAYLGRPMREIDVAYRRFVADLIDRDARRWAYDD